MKTNLNQSAEPSKNFIMTFHVTESLLEYFDKAGIIYKVISKGTFTNYWKVEVESDENTLTTLLLCADKHGNDRSFAAIFRFNQKERRA